MTKNTKKLLEIVSVDNEKCVNCHACITACPIKYCNDGSQDHVSINDDMCIGCGKCIDACTHGARIGVDDSAEFFLNLRSGEKVIAIAAPSVASNFPDKYLNLNGWLNVLGVEAVFDVSFGAELAVKSYTDYIKKNNPKCAISPACPVVVEYIQLYAEDLRPYLLPFDSPMKHTIKMIREYYPQYKDYSVAVISPCLAKRREFEAFEFPVYNVTYKMLERYLKTNDIDLSGYEPKPYANPPAERSVMFSSPGGLLSSAERALPGITQKSRKIEGPDILYPYFENLNDVINHDYNPLMIDCLNCDLGCNGGTGTDKKYDSRDKLEFFIAKRRQELEKFYHEDKDTNLIQDKDNIDAVTDKYWKPDLYTCDYPCWKDNNNIKTPNPSQVAHIYAEMHKYTEDDLYNCSSCGYGHCEDMAKAIYNGLNKSENCHYFQKTEIDHHNEQLQEANEFLKQEQIRADVANNAKSKFLAHMSHELRTPMTCIMGYTQMLQESDNIAPESLKKYTGSIFKSAELMSELINDILDFSKIEAGALLLENKPFDIKALIHEAGDVFLPKIQEKNLSIEYCLADNIPSQVVGDFIRIKQIFINLIGNAVKFTNEGKITIKATKKEIVGDNIIFDFAVTDTGISIPPDKKEAIFEAFSQVDASITRQYGGTGLGLSITQALIKMMDGQITVESEKGKGSCFSFFINLKKFKGEGGFLPDSPDIDSDISIKQDARILLAEDNLALREYVCELLDVVGADIDTVEDGAEAVDKALKNKYDLILMDINMPVMDGITASEKIREKASHQPPIVAFSAITTTDVIEKALHAGMDDYLTKPIAQTKFFKILNKYIHTEDK